jgi:hypothetical protein
VLSLQRVVGNQAVSRFLARSAQLQSAAQHGYGCGCCGCDVPQVSKLDGGHAQRAVHLQRSSANIITGKTTANVIQRNPKLVAYDRGYAEGFEEGFEEGLNDGLKELVKDKIISRDSAQLTLARHRIILEFPPGYRDDFDESLGRTDNKDAGAAMGRGRGFDSGYETALRDYGYSRKYQVIPNANKLTALGDNGGTCVYCNLSPSADVDHIEPLKIHWRTRGSTMELTARSDEANDTRNLVGACATCNRSKGAKKLGPGWWPPGWAPHTWWPYGPVRVAALNNPPPYW